jgi:TolA-binding protein
MKTIWHRVTRLLNPITLAVILVGVTGFLLGLIVAVERQDAVVVAPKADVEASDRTAQLEAALASREAELTELQNQLTQLRDKASSPPAIVDANTRIASLETALANSTAELNTLQRELDELSGQLADAIQSRDELRAQSERARLDNENERASLQQNITDLTVRLAVAEEAVRVQAEGAASEEPSPPAEAPAEPVQAAVDGAAAAPEPADATPSVPAGPAEPSRAESADASTPSQQTATAAPTGGPIAQGIAAYRAAEYRKAYELWLPAALKGSARAQFYVGALYFEGRGVPTDRVMSYMWLRAATNANDPGAVKLLDRVREGMSGPELAEAETRIANGETIPAQ